MEYISTSAGEEKRMVRRRRNDDVSSCLCLATPLLGGCVRSCGMGRDVLERRKWRIIIMVVVSVSQGPSLEMGDILGSLFSSSIPCRSSLCPCRAMEQSDDYRERWQIVRRIL